MLLPALPPLRLCAAALKPLGLCALIAVAITVACAGTTAQPTPTAPADAAPAIVVPTVDPNETAIQSHLATKVLETGTQRVAFLLTTQKALVNAPQARISVARQDDAAELAQVVADFNEWPYGVRGSYAAAVDFPAPGDYVLTVTPIGGDVGGEARIPVSVLPDASVPSVGDVPPASQTKILSDGGLTLADVTTAYQPDAELYRVSVADAVGSGRPGVIVFATPAFCTSPTCGPQVDTVSELRAANPDAANYVHVELYDNPAEIQGDLSAARLVAAADEWGFTQIPHWTNESWVFVLDADGVIRSRFEGFATLSELQAALNAVAGP